MVLFDMDTVADVYRKLMLKPRSWMGLNRRTVSVAILQHSGGFITESVEFDNWMRTTDVGYPNSSTDIVRQAYGKINHYDYVNLQSTHNDWMDQHHDIRLQYQHRSKVTPDDHSEFQKLIVGGHEFGYDSGSRDVSDHLVQTYRDGKPMPSEFQRSPKHIVDLMKVDAALKKNTFDDIFHSFHGVGFNPSAQVQQDGVLHLPAYSSGSVNRNIALKYAAMSPTDGQHHILHIIHPRASTGIYFGNEFYKDNEVLLPRHMTLQVHTSAPNKYLVDGKHVNVWVANRLSHLES